MKKKKPPIYLRIWFFIILFVAGFFGVLLTDFSILLWLIDIVLIALRIRWNIKSTKPNNDASKISEINWANYKTAPPEEIPSPTQQIEEYPDPDIDSVEISGDDLRSMYSHSGIAYTWKLTSSGSKSIQPNINPSILNTQVVIQRNPELDRYSVSAENVLIGYLSKSARKTYDEDFLNESYLAFVDSFSEDSKGNSIPSVSIFVPGSPLVVREHDWEPAEIPSSRPDYRHRITPVGIAFPCKKGFAKNRQTVMRKLKLGDIVDIEKYMWEGKPAYMFVDRKSGLDFGVMPASEAAYVSDVWKIKRFEAYVIYTGACRGYDQDLDDYTTQHTCDVYVYFFK